MKIVVCGAGVIGVTTAYVLASRGHEVTVIDRNPEPSAETSFANGGQLSYCHAEPWANPGVIKKLPKWLLKEDSPLIFRLRADLPMYLWGLQFLWNCQESLARKSCLTMLRLGLYSKQQMAAIRAAVPLEFDFLNKGILHIYSKEEDMQAAIQQAAFQDHYGSIHNQLTREQALTMEPALNQTSRHIVGALHSPMDESGDPKKFTMQLAEYIAKNYGVIFHYNTEIQHFRTNQTEIEGILTHQGGYQADAYIVCTASYAPQLLNPIGVRVPIYPMKGYSITIPAGAEAPDMSLTDGTYKIVYSKLGNRMRVAGTAEFAGHDASIRQSRIAPIVRAAKELFPKLDWETGRTDWACLRPQTPSGPPKIGKAKFTNLYLNTGHGTLGWTQAAGSAFILADQVEGKTPEIDVADLIP